jgi:hypothetical protein
MAMSNPQDIKSQPVEKPEPQKITPQADELDAGKLDEISGGSGGVSGTVPHHGPGPISP